MNNRSAGIILLLTAGLLVTLSMGISRIAYAIERGLLNISSGGPVPKSPTLDIPTIIISAIFMLYGIYLLRKNNN